MSRPKIAILASGSGTTAEAFIHATQTGIVDAEVTKVVSNSTKKGVFKRVDHLNELYNLQIEKVHISGITHPGGVVGDGMQTEEESAAIDAATYGHDLRLNLGYMKKILNPWGDRELNTHPGLLPLTLGLYGIHVQEKTLEDGAENGGQTLHIVTVDYDKGPIVAEHIVAVEPGDTPQTLFDRVQIVEKAELPNDVQIYLHGQPANAYEGTPFAMAA